MAAPGDPWERPPEAVIAAGAAFEGLLQLSEPARIDGLLTGTVLAAGTVLIGASGHVRACIEAEEVVVEGELEGEVRASRKIELRPSARVTAVLATPSLVLAEGSFFEGRCETVGGEKTPAPGAPETRPGSGQTP